MKKITNLAITGITKLSQLNKLAELTSTESWGRVCTNTDGMVYYSVNNDMYADWREQQPKSDAIHLTWKQFLAKYDNPCKRELKRIKKENKRLLALLEPWTPSDKELVWCWGDSYTHMRVLRFYSSVNNCTYDGLGGIPGPRYDNYAPYEGKLPKWAKKARKTLAD